MALDLAVDEPSCDSMPTSSTLAEHDILASEETFGRSQFPAARVLYHMQADDVVPFIRVTKYYAA